jgi:hypothetical protein
MSGGGARVLVVDDEPQILRASRTCGASSSRTRRGRATCSRTPASAIASSTRGREAPADDLSLP